MFYGANGHYDYLQSIDEQIAGLRTMGMETGYYRVTYEGHQHSLDYLHNLARALRGTGIRMICCINMSMCNADGELYENESGAFHAGYKAGFNGAKTLVPLGVTIFEMGNELDAKEGIRTPEQAVQGGMTWDFLNSHFPGLRGVMNGCMSAVRAVGGPTVQIASNAFTACSIACADMLWDGTQPDGSTGHPKLRFNELA
jgi:hypothetical protein